MVDIHLWEAPLALVVRSLVVLLLGVLLLLVAPAAAASSDFRIEHGEDGWEFSSEQGVVGDLVEAQEGESYAWRLEADRSRLVGEVVVPADLFDVQRVRQVLPRVDDRLFFEVRDGQVEEAEGGARVVNITRLEDGGFVYRLSFPLDEGSDEAVFSLLRDVEPPGFEIAEVQNLSHNRFYVESQTDEPAWGTLEVWPVSSGEEEAVPLPTTTPSYLQKFPVRGLKAETEYRFHVEFMDWSGNQVASDPVEVTTLEKVVGESPLVLSVYPEPDAVLQGPPEAIEAEVDPVAGGFPSRGVRLFVDLEEVSQILVEEDRVRYVPPQPFGPGDHVVRLELTNTEGGEAEKRWSFTVEDEEEEAGGPFFFVTAAVLVAVLATVRAFRRPT